MQIRAEREMGEREREERVEGKAKSRRFQKPRVWTVQTVSPTKRIFDGPYQKKGFGEFWVYRSKKGPVVTYSVWGLLQSVSASPIWEHF